MRNLTVRTLVLSAIALGSFGCSETPKAFVNSGEGFAMLTPARETKAFIVNQDAAFARQVLAHNATCARMSGCAK